jgi:phosphoribosylanthranilate isomerase
MIEPPRVKVCGITNLEDALAAVAAGADYLGFIFFPPSKRAIEVAQAAGIASVLRQRPDCPLLVGVFVNETAGQIASILNQCHLDLAQLSGEEPPALIGEKRSPIYGRSYKALRPTSLAEAEADAEWYLSPAFAADAAGARRPVAPALLIDSYHPTLRGGSGETGDWAMSARLAAKVPGLMLAGGLTADNVVQAVRQVRPFAVDVASGVEDVPGRKDHRLLHAFVSAAKRQ